MTTITDELAAALHAADGCLEANGVLQQSVVREIVSNALAKYEAAKAQEADRQKEVSKWVDDGSFELIPTRTLIRERVEGLKKAQETEKGFPVVKVPGHVVNHMEWRDHALIVTVGPREPAPSKSDIWNFITSASNFIQELKNGIEALQRSTVTGLSQNIAGLVTTATARSIFIEEWRKRLLPENYPARQVPNDLVKRLRLAIKQPLTASTETAVVKRILAEAADRIEALEAEKRS